MKRRIEMVTVIKKGASRKRIREVLDKLESRSRKGFNAHKHCGVLTIEEDALEIQKRMRNEWE